MTAALEGGEWSAACPDRTLPAGKTRYPFYRGVGGPQGRSLRAENLVPTGIRSQTVEPVVSRYTDWATRPTNLSNIQCLHNDKHCDESSSNSHSVCYWSIHLLVIHLTRLIVTQSIRSRIMQYLRSVYPPTNAQIQLIRNSLKTFYMFRQQGAILRHLVVQRSTSSEDGNSVPKYAGGF